MSDQYEERYCAFIDILGFRELISRLRSGGDKFQGVIELLRKIQQPAIQKHADWGAIDFQAQSISDAVCLSTALNISGLAILFDTLEQLSLALLDKGYFTRGALCRGMLYHDHQIVFGEALIKAYNLETEVVRYPRMMLTKQVVDDAMASNLKQYFVEYITQAADGPYFLHVLLQLRRVLDTLGSPNATGLAPEYLSHLEDNRLRFASMEQQIKQRFEEAVDNPRHFEKVQWFARYWNDTVLAGRHEGFTAISGVGLG